MASLSLTHNGSTFPAIGPGGAVVNWENGTPILHRYVFGKNKYEEITGRRITKEAKSSWYLCLSDTKEVYLSNGKITRHITHDYSSIDVSQGRLLSFLSSGRQAIERKLLGGR